MNSFELIQEQKQTLSAAQLQSLSILSMTNQELESFLTEEYLENPLLDCSIDHESAMMNDLENMYEKGASYKEHVQQAGDSGLDVSDDTNRRGDIRARETNNVTDMLLTQLDLSLYEYEDLELCKYLIACLDEKGFFPYTAEEIAGASVYSVEKVRSLLNDLRSLEPAGVFAYDISDCLLLQLERKGEVDPTLRRILTECMPDVLSGRFGNVTRTLSISTATVKEYVRLIGTLNPRPFLNMESDSVQYIISDVMLSWKDDVFTATLNDNWMGEYKYDDYYLHMMQTVTDPELKNYFKEKMKRAHFVIDAVEQRRNTILKIAEAIAARQKEFFLVGGDLKPMTLQMIADEAHVHPSTVSRAIQGKYIQFRRPVLMKQLFIQATGAGTPDTSTDVIRKKIRTLIEKEDAAHPLSDAKLEAMLSEEGLNVPRRTIAKYRIQMGIPDSRKRAVVHE